MQYLKVFCEGVQILIIPKKISATSFLYLDRDQTSQNSLPILKAMSWTVFQRKS